VVDSVLSGAPVLVAEDQTFIALDLALAIEDAGGQVVGPAVSVAEALELLATVEVAAAILDVDLVDGDCSPVLEALENRSIPTIVQTGVELPVGLATRFPNLVVHNKPCSTSELIAELEAMIVDHGRAGALA
jgi:DNA-binding response OmpR family regulator